VSRILVVTAVPAERDALLAGRHSAAGSVGELPAQRCQTGAGLVDVICGGVGPVAAALSTAAALGAAAALSQQVGYQLVLAAGIGGGFGSAGPGSLVVADAVVLADLGAETADGGFSPLSELGWGEVRFGLDRALTAELAARAEASIGAVLTVSTVTGTAARAEALHKTHPDALAEAMEGAGVYQAARRANLPFAELRAISNRVGPRDRDSWQIGPALSALGRAFGRILAEPLTTLGVAP
jgi:futalosine hydrolase